MVIQLGVIDLIPKNSSLSVRFVFGSVPNIFLHILHRIRAPLLQRMGSFCVGVLKNVVQDESTLIIFKKVKKFKLQHRLLIWRNKSCNLPSRSIFRVGTHVRKPNKCNNRFQGGCHTPSLQFRWSGFFLLVFRRNNLKLFQLLR